MGDMVMPLIPLPEPPPPDNEPELLKMWIRGIERDKQWCSCAQMMLRRGEKVGRRQGVIVSLLAVSIVYVIGWMI